MRCFSAAYCSEQTPREATLRRESQTSRGSTGDIFLLNHCFFSRKLLSLSVCTCYGEKATKRVWKLIILCKSCARVCETWELMAAGGGGCCGLPQINQCMGNTGGCLWECRQFLSTQNEQYETRRARGDFPLVNLSPMVSLSRAD